MKSSLTKLTFLIGLACSPTLLSVDTSVADETFQGVCQTGPGKGAQVKLEKYCNLFRYYDDNPAKALDTRIADALQVKSSRETRAIGLIIAVSAYPKLSRNDLPAAAVDGQRLVDFLVNTQQFDEVIALTDQDASIDTIHYFLKRYLPDRASEYTGKARLFIAYSGHGRFGGEDFATSQKPALILSDADAMDATDGVYDMQDFYGDIKALAGTNDPKSRLRSAFHVITLINACYGGQAFTDGKTGGNPDDFTKPGSYAITAGDDKHEVPSLIEKRGSLFFDLFIEGVTSGAADPQYWDTYRTIENSGKPSDPHGLTRFLPLITYLTGTYHKVEMARHGEVPPLTISAPWYGAAQSDVARGGFFFLSDYRTGASPNFADIYKPTVTTSQLSLFGEKVSKAAPFTFPSGPISALPGRPDVLVFKAPETYPIRGYDVSSNDGVIDWAKLLATEHPRFIYARAVGWSGIDNQFSKRLEGAKSIGVDYGAYAKFDFCLSPKEQLSRLREVFQRDDKALPVAIELVHPLGESQTQLLCLQKAGMEAEQQAIIQFASGVREVYGKIPLLSGNRNNLSQLTDERSDQFMIWMGNYGIQNVRLQGRNPWTLWQYSGSLTVPGIGPDTTGDAFFGTEEQYSEFKTGKANVAKAAATGGEPR